MKKPQAIFTAILTPFSLVVALASVEHKQTKYLNVHFNSLFPKVRYTNCNTNLRHANTQTRNVVCLPREFAIATEH